MEFIPPPKEAGDFLLALWLKELIEKELKETYKIYDFEKPLYECFRSALDLIILNIETKGYPWEAFNR